MTDKLFSAFDPVSAKAFKQHIQYDLKGADYNDSVVWNSPEGIDVKPFYHREDLAKPLEIPGSAKVWKIAQEIFILDPTVSAQTANDAVSKGVEALFFKAEKNFKSDLLFKHLEDKYIPVYLNFDFLEVHVVNMLFAEAGKWKTPLFANCDTIGNLARSGNWFAGMDQDFAATGAILDKNPQKSVIGIDSSLYQNAGATMVQQLAYALAHANEYLNHFGDKLKDSPLMFKVSLGGNYFFEIAKIRALRLLYSALAKAYQLPKTCHVIATPSRRNKVIYDYNTNMLRTTTECMSAVLGGADTVLNLPYDALYHKTNDFAERISRNQLLVLKEESYFDKVSNPAQGSYYIESLTQQLAEKSMKLFKELEKAGGFLKHLKAGIIQQKIKENAWKEQALFDEGIKSLLGTNKHPNPDDRMKDDLQLYPFVKTKPRKTLIEPIIPRRLAEEIEKKRLENEE